MSGAELRLLHHEVAPWLRAERLLHVLGSVPDDDGGGYGMERAGRLQHAVDERSSGDLVQHLRPLGLHPRAFAGCEYDDVKVGHRKGLSLPLRGCVRLPDSLSRLRGSP